MRPSNKNRILESAYQILATDGAGALTYDALANATGITKGGLLYHFPSKDDLIDAVVSQMWRRWDTTTAANLTSAPNESTEAERLTAEITTTVSDTIELAELSAFVTFMRDERHRISYRERLDQWFDFDALSTAQHVAYLAAEGLWLSEATGSTQLSPQARDRAVQLILDLASTTT